MVVQRQPDGTVRVGFSREAVDTHHQISAVVMIVSALPLESLERLAEEYRLAETTLPIFDPTAFMWEGGKLEATKQVTDALLGLSRVIEEVRDDLG